MIEEIFAFFLSVVSLFASDPPQLSHQNDVERVTTSEESEDNDLLWRDKIHREYKREDEHQLSRQATDYVATQNYVSVGSESRLMPSLGRSVQRGLRASLTIVIAAFPVGLLGIAFLYFDLNTADLCFKWRHHNNGSIPLSLLKWKLIGENVEAAFIDLWFSVTLILLFGWTEFKSNHMATLYVGFATAGTVVIYQTVLFVFGVFATRSYYRYPGIVMCAVDVIWGSVLVVRKVHNVHPPISKLQIFTLIPFAFIAGISLSYVYGYGIVPLFNKQKTQMNKLLVATIAPVATLLPIAICKYFVLRRSAEIIQPERSFLLLYFLHGTPIFLYRIMQANFNSRWLFIGLSLFSAFSNVAKQATRGIRGKIWTRVIKCLKKTSCCRRLEQIPCNTPHHRRLEADTEIQNMLCEYNTLIMSQAYLVLYLITNYQISAWPVLKESLVRVTIGLAIDFVFNCLSIFIQIHWYDIPIRRVWLKYWKRHILANVILSIGILSYFSPILLGIFQIRIDKSNNYNIRNCTLPLNSW